MGRCSTRRSRNAATCRCRPISRRAARLTNATPTPIRPYSRGTRARRRSPPPGSPFADGLVAAWGEREIGLHKVTLHVGAGTFLPVKAADTADHHMHAEHGSVSAATVDALNTARAAGGRIVAVGSTSLRLIESAADEAGRLRPFEGETALFITPGYKFRAVDVMMTNFHLPRSTLFMLVAAFAGLDTMRGAYVHAIAQGYRFYSYGDACLLFRA